MLKSSLTITIPSFLHCMDHVGKIYGDRPPLILSSALTKFIDDYLIRFRPCLKPTGNHFFVQQRTGNAFSQDSVYSIVARACYKYSGKKTNPHLLRDMIVTHRGGVFISVFPYNYYYFLSKVFSLSGCLLWWWLCKIITFNCHDSKSNI